MYRFELNHSFQNQNGKSGARTLQRQSTILETVLQLHGKTIPGKCILPMSQGLPQQFSKRVWWSSIWTTKNTAVLLRLQDLLRNNAVSKKHPFQDWINAHQIGSRNHSVYAIVCNYSNYSTLLQLYASYLSIIRSIFSIKWIIFSQIYALYEMFASHIIENIITHNLKTIHIINIIHIFAKVLNNCSNPYS